MLEAGHDGAAELLGAGLRDLRQHFCVLSTSFCAIRRRRSEINSCADANSNYHRYSADTNFRSPQAPSENSDECSRCIRQRRTH